MKTLTMAVGGLILAAGIAIGARSQADDLHKLFSDYYEFKLREDPRMATSVGRTDYNDRWDDPSPEHLRVRRAELQKLLDLLHAIPVEQTAGQDRLNWRVMDWTVTNEIKDIELLSNYFAVNGFVGAHLNIFSTPERAGENRKRLRRPDRAAARAPRVGGPHDCSRERFDRAETRAAEADGRGRREAIRC